MLSSLPSETEHVSNEMPRMEELLVSVEFSLVKRSCRNGEELIFWSSCEQFTRYSHTRANDWDRGSRGEAKRLNKLVHGDGTLDELRWKLVKILGVNELDAPGLEDYLRLRSLIKSRLIN